MLTRASQQRRWTWRAALQRARQVLRDEGVKSLWFKVLGQTVYRRVVLMECRLDQPLGYVTARLPVVIDRLRRSEFHEYAAFRPDADPSEMLDDGLISAEDLAGMIVTDDPAEAVRLVVSHYDNRVAEGST